MNRTIHIMLGSCILFTIAACEASAATPEERKPNVIVILADDI